jgi:hypothetical protein
MNVASQKNGPEPDTKEERERERDLPGHGKAGEKFRVIGCTHPPTRKQKHLDVALSIDSLSVDSLPF